MLTCRYPVPQKVPWRKAICDVDAIRKSLEPTDAEFLETGRPDNHTSIDKYHFVLRKFLAAFTDLNEDNQSGNSTSGWIEAYLSDPLTAFDGNDILE